MKLIRIVVVMYAFLAIVFALFEWRFFSNWRVDEQQAAVEDITHIKHIDEENLSAIGNNNEDYSQSAMEILKQIEEGSLTIEEVYSTPYFVRLAREEIDKAFRAEDSGILVNHLVDLEETQILHDQPISPYDHANRLYEDEGWATIIDKMNLSGFDKHHVRDIYLEFSARNFELSEQKSDGLISWEQWAAAYGRFEDLLQRLSPILSASQIAELRDHGKLLEEEYKMQAAQATRHLLESGNAGLLTAVSSDDFPTVSAYLRSGADPNIASDDGRTPLARAASTGNPLMAQALIDAGAEVDWPPSGSGIASALAWAASKGHIESVRVLIAAGADLEHYARYRFDTALQRAALAGHAETVRVLLEAGADVTGDAGEEALASAIRLGDLEMEQMLIDAGANANSLSATSQRMLKEIGRRAGFVND